MQFIKSIVAISIVLGLSGCGGSGSGPDTVIEPTTPSPTEPDQVIEPTNTPPTVTAEFPEQTISAEQQTVTLAVSASDNGSIASYHWQQTSGITVNLNGADNATATFDTPMVTYDDGPQALTFTVTVSDDQNAQTTSTLSVTIEPNNHAPTLTIAGPQSVYSKDSMSFTANASDIDGSITSYQWQQLSGSTLTFDVLNQATISAIAPEVASSETVKLQLTVNDDKGAMTTSSVEFQINPIPFTLSADTLISAKSGGFAKLNWQVSSSNEQLTYRLVREDTNETLPWLTTAPEQGTFNAPVAFDGDLSVPLILTVENAVGQAQSQALTLNLQAADNLFAAKKSLLQLANNGITVRAADLADLNSDGEPDLIVVSATGTRWYRNKGHFDFDLNGLWVSSYGNWPYNKRLAMLDLDGDNDLDFVLADNSGLYYRINNGQGEFTLSTKLADLAASYSYSETRLLQAFTIEDKRYLAISARAEGNTPVGHFYLYQFNGTLTTLVSHQSFDGYEVMDTTISTCDLNSQGQPDIYFRTQFVRAGAGDRATHLYQLNYLDNYQSTQLLSSDDAYHVDMFCVRAKDEPDRLLQYIEGSSSDDQTTRIKLVDGQYETIRTTVQLRDHYTYGGYWQGKDINGDGKDDLVNKHNGVILLRNDLSGFNFSAYSTRSGAKLAESSGDFYRIKTNRNDILVSDKFPFDDSYPVTITMPQDVKISKLQVFGEHLLVTQSGNAQSKNVLMKLNSDGVLEENSDIDFSPFNTNKHFFSGDHNGDGQLDVFYQYDFDDGSSRGATAIAVAVAQNGGFLEPEVLLTYEQQQPSLYFSRLEDIDGDGHLDFTLANNEVVYYEQWFLYNNDSQSYEEALDLSWYGVDIDQNYHGSSRKQFGDFDGDGDKDILRIGDFKLYCGWSDCGYVQVAQQTESRQYTQWQNMIEPKMFIESLRIADVDQDGLDDILFSGIPYSDGNDPFPATWRKWYRYNEQGQFEANDMNTVPYTYTKLFADKPAYFVNLNTTLGEVSLYQFNQEFKRPVIEQTVSIDKTDMQTILFDLDKDGDLDILLYQDYEAFWIENLGR